MKEQDKLDKAFQIYSNFQDLLFDADRIPEAVLALILSAILGSLFAVNWSSIPPAWNVFDYLFGRIGERLDKKTRGRSDLVFRGLLFSFVMLAIAYGIGQFFDYLRVHFRVMGATETLTLVLFLCTGASWTMMMRVYQKLTDKKSSPKASSGGAFLCFSRSSRLDLNSVDDHGIVRLGLVFLARMFDKGLVAPVFWYLIVGIPGVVIYGVLAFLAWRFGKDGFSKGFGVLPLVLEKLMGFIPSFLAAILLVFASIITPGAGIVRSISSWFQFQNKASYEQGGYPVSVLSWAFDVGLGGPVVDIDGSTIAAKWVGPEGASAKLEPDIMRRGIYIIMTAHLLFFGTLLGAYIVSGF